MITKAKSLMAFGVTHEFKKKCGNQVRDENERKAWRYFGYHAVKKMKCPFCGYEDTKVADSRPNEEGTAIRRRRECESCKKRFTTYEKIETIPLMVIKKDGTTQSFDRAKIEKGVLNACYKRPVSAERLAKLVDDIESTINGIGVREITSSEIGEIVMDKIKEVDQVAYVRFASVYREFKDVNTFIDEIKKLTT